VACALSFDAITKGLKMRIAGIAGALIALAVAPARAQVQAPGLTFSLQRRKAKRPVCGIPRDS